MRAIIIIFYYAFERNENHDVLKTVLSVWIFGLLIMLVNKFITLKMRTFKLFKRLLTKIY